MSYQVLARKWRPRTFDEVVGQATVTRTLKNALASGRIGHAFLLSGARGVGKTTTARILAKALNCGRGEAPTAEPCLECASCVEIAAGTSLDVQEIDGATNNGVEQVRELRESARYNPARDRFKVWIIDEVHMLSAGAFNALLKTLEEPPPRVKFVFATTEYHKLPDTIVSRCQQYELRMIPARELAAHLRRVADEEKVQVSDDALARVARAAEGSVRDALSLFDQVLSFSGERVDDADIVALLGLIDRELLLGASQAVAAGDSLGIVTLVERLADYGADYRNFARELLLHFREILLAKLAPGDSALLAQLAPEERQRLRPLSEAFSEEDLLRALDVLTKLDTDLRWAQDPRVTLELALLKLVQMRRLLPFTELVERVERMGGGSSGEPSAARRASAGASSGGEGPATAARPAAAAASPPLQPTGARSERRSERPAPSTADRAGEPGPAPAVAPAPAASASGDPAEALLAAMAAEARPSLAQALRGARAGLEGDRLRLEVARDFTTFASTHADEYRDLARRAAGRPLKVEIRAVEQEPGGAAPAEQAKQQDLMQQATREPAVQEILDLFNGTVVDVRGAGEPAKEGV
jgi:DNA polymerase-3 subunit gamma/tau